MKQFKYSVFIEKNEDRGYAATVPSLPGCIREGDYLGIIAEDKLREGNKGSKIS